MPGRLYDVGGHRLHLNCTGTGSPTVVLENGLGEISPLWSAHHRRRSPAPPGSAPTTAPGRAGATTPPTRRTASPVAADLHTLLARAGETRPVRPGRALLRRRLRHDLRRPLPRAGRRDGAAGLVQPAPGHRRPTSPAPYADDAPPAARRCPRWPASARCSWSRPRRSTALSPSAAAQVQAFATSPRGASNMRDEQAQLPDVFAQAQALTTLGPKPLAVVTARENADGTTGWAAAQDRMAALSTNSSHWVADTTHVGLLDDAPGRPTRSAPSPTSSPRCAPGTPLASAAEHARPAAAHPLTRPQESP